MMSLEKMVADARQLVSRLHEHDSSVDSLISNAQGLFTRISIMKQYEEDVAELGGFKPSQQQQPQQQQQRSSRSQLVLGIAQESRQMRELRQENEELRAYLEEHQAALELIMSKYREQMMRVATSSQLEHTVTEALRAKNGVETNADKICELVAVMRAAAALDDASADRVAEHIARLELENKGLRDLLFISRKYGSKDIGNAGDDNDVQHNSVLHSSGNSSFGVVDSQNSTVRSGADPPQATEVLDPATDALDSATDA